MRHISVQDALDEAYKLHVDLKAGDKEAGPKIEALYNFALDHAEPNTEDFGKVCYLAGTFYTQAGKLGLGATLLSASLKQTPGFAPAWNNLGLSYLKRDKFALARNCFMKSLEEIGGPDGATINNIATTCSEENKHEDAVRWYGYALELDPTNTEAAWNKSFALLSMQNWGEGWDAYDMGHLTSSKKRGLRNYAIDGEADHPVYNGEDGKCVVVWGEQGVGDEILFANCLPDLIAKSKHVIFDCHKRLYPIFKRTFPGITIFPTREETELKWAVPKCVPKIESKIAIGSLPRIFRRTAESFPKHSGYMKADPELVERYRDRSKFRVGIAWIGGTHLTKVDRRSIPLDMFAPILSVPNIEFVSLQYTKDAQEHIDGLPEELKARIVHDQDMIDDLDKQFACIQGLDLVISVNQSAVHFAGSLGVPCWTITPKVAAWRYAGETMPWYPSVEIIRQEERGNWIHPIVQAAQRLNTLRNG